MFLLRSCRIKACEIKAASRYFTTFSKNHYCRNKYKACVSNLSYCVTARIQCQLLGFQSSYSTENSNTSDILNVADQSHFSDSFYGEEPDVTNCSEIDAEHFRKNNNIIVKGDDIPEPIMDFSDLPLPEVLKGILEQENYSKPTPIQSQGWPVAFNGRDVVGVSQTGSGKTLVYMLPAIVHASNRYSQRTDRRHDIPSPKVLVLGPTRELVQQILQVSEKYIFASHLKGACVYGGASRGPQLNHLRRAQICVATPGRLLDYLENRETSLKNCTYLVLDEADRMLDMGFEPQIREIIDHIPNERQTLMWSATWPKEIQNLAEDFLTNYIHITVGDSDLVANPNIQQNVYVVREGEKFEKFFSLMSDIMKNEPSKILVFAETKRKVNYLTQVLNDKGLVAWGIHGDYTQNQRDRVLRDFRRSSSSILIATDIASRGLDITDINHVFNYDFPTNIEDYIHRIGRTARGSACGKSHSFFTSENVGVLKDLLSVLKKANQQINPELNALLETAPSNFYKPQRRYNYNTPFSKNKIIYGKKRFNDERSRFSDEGSRFSDKRSRFSDKRSRMNYTKDWRSYVAS